MCCDFGDSPDQPQAPPADVLSALLNGRIIGREDEIRRAVLLLQLTGRVSPGPRPGTWMISGAPRLGDSPWAVVSERARLARESRRAATQAVLEKRTLETLQRCPEGLSGRQLSERVGGPTQAFRAGLGALRAAGKVSARPRSERGGGRTWTIGGENDAPDLVKRRPAPTAALEEKILATLRKHPGGLSGRRLEEWVGGPARVFRGTLKELHAAGRVTSEPNTGSGGGFRWKAA